MSYYFAIVGTKDNPLFEHEFGTSKHGGDGVARFREEARRMNQFIVHASLDIVDEVRWLSGAMYLKHIDRFQQNHISCFLTGANVKFLLLHNAEPDVLPSSIAPSGSTTLNNRASTISNASAGTASTSIAANPTSPATEEAIRQFFADVYESWVKAVMSPFFKIDGPVKSPVFRARVAGAAKKYL